MDEQTRSHGSNSRHGESKHHHSHSQRKRSNKLSRYLRKNRSAVINVVVIVLAIASVITIAILGERNRKTADMITPKPPEVSAKVYNGTFLQVQVPFYSKEVSLVSNHVLTYMRSTVPDLATEFFKDINPEGKRLDAGVPVTLSFGIEGLPVEYSVVSSIVEVSKSENLQDPRIFKLGSNDRGVEVHHLECGTQYYYQISITFSNHTITSVRGSFKTAPSPRILSIDGAVNVRDIGGWETVDGKTIRQGRLYRGSELDGAVEKEFSITEKGRNDMLTVLGICTDMDLRSPDVNTRGTHALGANVEHIYYDVPMYITIFQTPEKVRAVFSDLADESKYPVYMHCTYGMDRTGTFCYLLEALLGVSEENLMRDYQLTALQFSVLNDEYMHAFIGQLRLMEGNTMQEKVTNYLLSVGVTEEEIANIKYIFIQE